MPSRCLTSSVRKMSNTAGNLEGYDGRRVSLEKKLKNTRLLISPPESTVGVSLTKRTWQGWNVNGGWPSLGYGGTRMREKGRPHASPAADFLTEG